MQYDDLDDPLSVTQAADFVGVDKSTFYAYLREGKGPVHYRICGVIRIDKAEFRRWVESKRNGCAETEERGAA